MIELVRTIRFCINGPGEGLPTPGKHNTFSAWPPLRGLGRFYQAHVACVGEPDAVTGYFINIKEIDIAFRRRVIPLFEAALATDPTGLTVNAGQLVGDALRALDPELGGSVVWIRLELYPFHSIEIRKDAMSYVVMRQQYEFSAAHRLHCDGLSDEKNLAIFGKCNNPNGHGHNYRVEVAVRVPVEQTGRTFYVEQLDHIVDTSIIQKLDHKNLNVDVAEFAGRNSSVENISQVVFNALEASINQTSNMELEEVSVWETGKTVCTYRGQRSARVV